KRSSEVAVDEDKALQEEENVYFLKQQTLIHRAKRSPQMDAPINQPRIVYPKRSLQDPFWAGQWYLNRGKGLDMNVEIVWRKNFTGKGVVVSILDDGVE